MIFPTGFFRNKAKSLLGLAQALEDRFGGEVPTALEDLVTLPGVGRKTGNVVRSVAFDLPGLPVDTHVGRITRLLGLTTSEDPVKVEHELGGPAPPEGVGRLLPPHDPPRPQDLRRPPPPLRRMPPQRHLPVVPGPRLIQQRSSRATVYGPRNSAQPDPAFLVTSTFVRNAGLWPRFPRSLNLRSSATLSVAAGTPKPWEAQWTRYLALVQALAERTAFGRQLSIR